MAHYALLDENNIVVSVIVGADEGTDGLNWEHEYSQIFNQKCVRTSYNTIGGVHTYGGEPFRKNYAAIGGIYDESLDAFYAVNPYPSWTLNPETCLWEPPIPEPFDGVNLYRWDEETMQWSIFREETDNNV